MSVMNKAVPLLLAVLSGAVFAKLPALSDEAKAKAAETAAKTAWAGKVDIYQLCKSQDVAATKYYKSTTTSGKSVKSATATPACADPGGYVFTAVIPVAAKPIEAAGAHSPAATAAFPPNTRQPDAVVNPARKS